MIKYKQYIVLLLIFSFALLPISTVYAAAGYEAKDTGSLGNNQWRIRTDGDLEPNVDSTYEIGQSGNEVAKVYTDQLIVGGVTIDGTIEKQIPLKVGDLCINTPLDITASTAPGLEKDNNAVAIVWADGETTPVQTSFKVPSDYSSGGAFRLFVDESDSTTPNQVDFAVYVNTDGTTWDTTTSDQTPVALAGTAGTPDMITLNVATDFAALAASDVVTVNIWRDNTATGTGDLELYYGEFFYTGNE